MGGALQAQAKLVATKVTSVVLVDTGHLAHGTAACGNESGAEEVFWQLVNPNISGVPKRY